VRALLLLDADVFHKAAQALVEVLQYLKIQHEFLPLVLIPEACLKPCLLTARVGDPWGGD
jgi:hypothetical protein